MAPRPSRKRRWTGEFNMVRFVDDLVELAGGRKNLADLTGYNYTTFGHWRRGKCSPNIKLVAKLAAFYNLSLDDYVTESIIEPEHPDPPRPNIPTGVWVPCACGNPVTFEPRPAQWALIAGGRGR